MGIKRVAFLINSMGLGGAERVLSVLLENISKQSDLEYELILLEEEYFYAIPKKLKVTTLSNLTRKDSAMKRTLFIPLLAWRLARHCRQNKIDLVVSFIYRSDFVNVLAHFVSAHKVIVSNRVNASSTYGGNGISAKINRFLIQTLYPKADLVINVSKGIEKDLVENFAIPSKKQKVIYNPYDIEKIQALAKEPLEEAIDFPYEKSLITVSRLDEVKHIDLVIEAVAACEDSYLIVLGKGEQEEALKALTKRLGVEKRVYFAGLQSNPYKYMAKAAIYVSASHSEGFPNALVEAMICGCATLSSDCKSGPREILAPDTDPFTYATKGLFWEKYGALFGVGDFASLKEGMCQLLKDQTLQEAYRTKGKERVQDFVKDRVVKAYLQSIASVLEEA